MDNARLEEILSELETEATQSERRLWLSPEGELLGTKSGFYALALDLLRSAEKRKTLFCGDEKAATALFAGRLGGVERIILKEKAAEVEKEAARRERAIIWIGRLSVAAVTVVGLLFLYFFFWWWFSTV